MPKIADIVVATGSYTDSTGQEKKRWTNLGAMMENENGPYLLLDPTVSLPGLLMKQRLLNQKEGKTPGESILASVFYEEGRGPQKQAPAKQESQFSDDDIPF